MRYRLAFQLNLPKKVLISNFAHGRTVHTYM
jgi:hypothetical protein